MKRRPNSSDEDSGRGPPKKTKIEHVFDSISIDVDLAGYVAGYLAGLDFSDVVVPLSPLRLPSLDLDLLLDPPRQEQQQEQQQAPNRPSPHKPQQPTEPTCDKERFLMVLRLLMRYLEKKDPDMHTRAKSFIRECVEK